MTTLLNVSEVADLLRISKRTVWTMVHEYQTLRFVKVGRVYRFRLEDVEACLKSHSSGQNPSSVAGRQ